jgi:hypothetical protein
VTSLSGAKPCFFKSLRINFSAARLFLLVSIANHSACRSLTGSICRRHGQMMPRITIS